MNNFIFGNILDIKDGFIIHQVNEFGIIDKGLGKVLCDNYKGLKEAVEYSANLHRANDKSVLGTYHKFETDTVTIITCFTENGICSNRKEGDPANTSYDLIIKCFDELFLNHYDQGIKYYIPYKFGCGLAGGDWGIVSAILSKYDLNIVARIEDFYKDNTVNVDMWKHIAKTLLSQCDYLNGCGVWDKDHLEGTEFIRKILS